MSRRSFAFGSVIIIAWLITMGFLLKNHYLRPEVVPAFDNADLFISVEAVERWNDVEEYMLILQDGVEHGATATTISKTVKPDIDLTYIMQFALTAKLSPILPSANVKATAGLNSEFNLTKFHGAGDLGPARFSATGLVLQNILYLKIDKPNGSNKIKMKLQRPVSLSEAIRPTLGKQLKIKTGNKISIPILDPITGNNRGTMLIKIQEEEFVKVGGKPVKAYKVVSTLDDIATTMWIDSDGKTLKRQLVGNFTMERTSATVALNKYPHLAEVISIPQLDPAAFQDIPVTQPGNSSKPSGDLNILELLLQ